MTDQHQEDACTCTTEGYSPECPQVFVQGGQLLHTLQAETRLKPRMYVGPGVERQGIENNGPYLDNLRHDIRSYESSSESHEPERFIDAQLERLRLQNSDALGNKARQEPWKEEKRYISGEALRMGVNGSLDRFKPLTLNGMTLTGATIGGYKLNVDALSKKAASILPLPPVALPLIFADLDLNFSHHFFQGLEIIAGRQFVIDLAETKRYYDNDTIVFSPLIKELSKIGYKDGDAELVIFVKRVISTTFDVLIDATPGKDNDLFLVASNFYGFHYIENGMQCREQDLKMWLQSAYNQYRTQWFNAFKSSGIPDFALEGVQDRYSGLRRSYECLDKQKLIISDIANESTSERARRHSRKVGKSGERREEGRASIEPRSRGFLR